MNTPLYDLLLSQVSRLGPMTVAQYMAQCLGHPEHGYYTTKDPIGRMGDFVTSPEISQMFGEVLGLALAQAWIDQGSPDRFLLVELGPGRGTLMRDILRATKTVPGFQEAAHLFMVETSPVLRDLQKQTIAPYKATWVNSINELADWPIFAIGNEFFDCLPIRQFRRTLKGWQEQMIGSDEDNLGFVQGEILPDYAVADVPSDVPIGSIMETSSASAALAEDLARRVAKGGAVIIIDYGDWNAIGDTLQAVMAHQKVDPLIAPGASDLTAHVNFATLYYSAQKYAQPSRMVTQGALLARLGMIDRAEKLAEKMDALAIHEMQQTLERLMDVDQMGGLFKAIAFSPKGAPPVPGFDY